MKIVKFGITIGFSVSIIGFLIGVLAGEREIGKLVFLVGFFLGVAGLILLVFTGQPSGVRGAGLRIGATGFSISALGALISFFTSNVTIGDISFYLGAMLMIGGILFHLVMLARPKL